MVPNSEVCNYKKHRLLDTLQAKKHKLACYIHWITTGDWLICCDSVHKHWITTDQKLNVLLRGVRCWYTECNSECTWLGRHEATPCFSCIAVAFKRPKYLHCRQWANVMCVFLERWKEDWFEKRREAGRCNSSVSRKQLQSHRRIATCLLYNLI